MYSLRARLLISVSLVLVVFFGATIAVLDSAFRSAGEQAERDILDGYLMQLLAAAQPQLDGGLGMPPDLPESRFGTIESGLYAELRDGEGRSIWQSRSSIGFPFPEHPPPRPGVEIFDRDTLPDGTPIMSLRLAVLWEFPDGHLETYVFEVLEDLDSFNAQVSEYRRQLFTWFAVLALLLIVVLAVLLRQTLKPLKQIEREIGEMEQGERSALSGELPSELAGVARNLNLLIDSERGRSDRYRKTLDNLAHSLKTPLAAVRALFRDGGIDDSQRSRLDEQIDRMDEIVRYQLRKPASVDRKSLSLVRVDVSGETQRLVDGLSKVYAQRGIEIDAEIGDDARFRGDTGDFLELAGNILDNACKWASSRVLIAVGSADGDGLSLCVDDDGPGIPEEDRARLLERGTRLDEATPGHGIGLAIVSDIVASYRGELAIEDSPLGGARIRVTIPG